VLRRNVQSSHACEARRKLRARSLLGIKIKENSKRDTQEEVMRTMKRLGVAAIAAVAAVGLSVGAASARGPGGGGHFGGSHFGGSHFSGGHFGGHFHGGGFRGSRHFHGGGFGPFIGGLAFGAALAAPYYYDYGYPYYGPDCYIRRRVVLTPWGYRVRRYRVCY
jgi:hypothetical protein